MKINKDWIRVSDILPSGKNSRVLAFWDTRDPDDEPGGIEVSRFDGRNWQGADGLMDYHGVRRVTYWMPLPPPPVDDETFVCLECGADRFKESCEGDLSNCALMGYAHDKDSWEL